MDITIACNLKKGCDTAFRKVYDDYHQKLYSYFLKKTNCAYTSQELLQVTFIKLWRFRQNLDLQLPFSQQLFRIAKTCFIDYLRAKAKDRIIVVPSDQLAGIPEQLFSSDPLHDLLASVRLRLSRLSPVRRKIIEY